MAGYVWFQMLRFKTKLEIRTKIASFLMFSFVKRDDCLFHKEYSKTFCTIEDE